MNNAPLTLILIASLGIVAVISLGVFFAVRPKFAGTEQHLAADFAEQPQQVSEPPATNTHAITSTNIGQSDESNNNALPSVTSIPSSVSAEFTAVSSQNVLSSRVAEPPGQHSHSAAGVQSPGIGNPPARNQAGEPTFGQSSRRNGDREIVSTVEMLDSLRVAPSVNEEQDTRPSTSVTSSQAPSQPSSTVSQYLNSTRMEKATTVRELTVEKEIDMHRYGKVVGIAYRKGRLYVPSYQSGNISVYKADTLHLLNEYSCDGCHVYDIGVLSNGDLVLSQGKHSKITKLSGKSGNVVKEIAVSYSTKGVAVSNYDEVFVLSRDHDAVYVYDANLKQLGSIPIDNKAKNDCNFLAYGDDVIYVSCESATHVINVQGKEVQTLRPSQGTYAIGLAVSESGDKTYVGRRGMRVAEVYDKNGNYLESVGEKKDALWSDIAVGEKYLFVIEYITATIKQYSLL